MFVSKKRKKKKNCFPAKVLKISRPLCGHLGQLSLKCGNGTNPVLNLCPVAKQITSSQKTVCSFKFFAK